MGDQQEQIAALLQGMRDIHLPEAVSWWPPAPGWWLLFVLGVLFSVWAARRWHLLAWLNSLPYRFAALRELNDFIEQNAIHKLSDSEQLSYINRLLKRVVLLAYPQHPAIGYTGLKWVQFLDYSGTMNGFSRGKGKCLALEAYKANPRAELAAVYELGKVWIRRHQPVLEKAYD